MQEHPLLGVGPGNVQCIFDRGVDYEEGIQKAIAGRIFDNGIICSSEQTVIVPEEDFDEVMKTAVRNGAFYIEGREDVDKIRAAVFPDGKMNRNLVGQSPAKILEAAGFEAPEGVKVIIVRPEGYGRQDDLSKEKMCPLMSAYSYKTWENAVDIACANLAVEGRGHSTAIHSHDKAHIEYAAGRLPVSRVVVNQVCSTNAGGAFMNGLNPTTTLGCGTWGNNSISENLTYYHLMNKTRIAYVKPGWKQPADDEIWG